jgi:8-oxo-dGTP diphosphatase
LDHQKAISFTADAVLTYNDDKSLHVLLIKRKHEPFKGEWALPGGFVEKDELVIEACRRELLEETGVELEVDLFEFIDYYDAVSRDPRRRTITFAFLTKVSEQPSVLASDDALEAEWFSVEQLPKLAFDHFDIIQDALKL